MSMFLRASKFGGSRAPQESRPLAVIPDFQQLTVPPDLVGRRSTTFPTLASKKTILQSWFDVAISNMSFPFTVPRGDREHGYECNVYCIWYL